MLIVEILTVVFIRSAMSRRPGACLVSLAAV
jgi:hypothetical protein